MSDKKIDKRKLLKGVQNPKKANKTSFVEGNKFGVKYTEEQYISAFLNALEKIKESLKGSAKNKIVTLGGFYLQTGIPVSTCKLAIETYPALTAIKEELCAILNEFIATKALDNEFNQTASIWRHKQLGEKDNTEKFVERRIEMTEAEKDKRIAELVKKAVE